MTVGRQALRFGNALIIGDPDTSNTYLGGVPAGSIDIHGRDLSARKSFDAIRATLDYSPWILDIVSAKIDENDPTAKDDVNLYGVNANYNFGDNKGTIAEIYYFEKDNASLNKDDHVRTVGVRTQSMPIENLILGAEVAHQFGTYTANALLYPEDSERTAGMSDKRDAWAAQVGANAFWPEKEYVPSLGLVYLYMSGEKDGDQTGLTYRGWDPMFIDQGVGTIINAIQASSNCHVVNLTGSIKPKEDLTAKVSYFYVLLDKPFLNNTSHQLTGIVTMPSYTMTDKDHIGDEVDVELMYDYTEDVQLGLNAGVFMPGNAFDQTNDRNAYQVIGSMKVTF